MTLLGRWHFQFHSSNSINNKLILTRDRLIRDSFLFLHFLCLYNNFNIRLCNWAENQTSFCRFSSSLCCCWGGVSTPGCPRPGPCPCLQCRTDPRAPPQLSCRACNMTHLHRITRIWSIRSSTIQGMIEEIQPYLCPHLGTPMYVHLVLNLSGCWHFDIRFHW